MPCSERTSISPESGNASAICDFNLEVMESVDSPELELDGELELEPEDELELEPEGELELEPEPDLDVDAVELLDEFESDDVVRVVVDPDESDELEDDFSEPVVGIAPDARLVIDFTVLANWDRRCLPDRGSKK